MMSQKFQERELEWVREELLDNILDVKHFYYFLFSKRFLILELRSKNFLDKMNIRFSLRFKTKMKFFLNKKFKKKFKEKK